MTYSWDFGDAIEEEDRRFLRSKLDNFRRLGIRTHAYVQGTNLVAGDHRDRDVFCRDARGRTIPYHRGRRLCCVLKPRFRALFLSRIERAASSSTTCTSAVPDPRRAPAHTRRWVAKPDGAPDRNRTCISSSGG